MPKLTQVSTLIYRQQYGKNRCLPKPRLLSPSHPESVVIKCEPDFSIVECKSPSEKKFGSHTVIKSPEMCLGQNFSVNPKSFSSNIASRIYNIPNPKVSLCN